MTAAATPLGDIDLPWMDLTGAEFLTEPYRVLADMRERSWCVVSELGLNILTYADVTALLRSPKLGGVGDSVMQSQGVTDGVLREFVIEGGLFAMSGARHNRIRGAMISAFTPRAVDVHRPMMRAVAQRLVGEFADSGRCDLVAQFTNRYPVEVAARMIGVPTADIPRFSMWSADVGLAFNVPLAPVMTRAEEAVSGLRDYVDMLIADRRKALGTDLISALIRAAADGEVLSEKELGWGVMNLIFAGHDTTRQQTAAVVAELTACPADWVRIADDPALAANAVEEGMRLRPIIPASFRFVVEDFEHRNLLIPQGTILVLRADAANRDPDVFTAPDQFDVRRSNAKVQLSFGAGAHYCLGVNLARAEMQEALPVLARAMPEISLDGEAEWKAYSDIVTGPNVLPLAWTPRP